MKKKIIILAISIPALVGVCALLWQGLGSSDDAYIRELEENKKAAKPVRKKKRQRVLTPAMIRTDKLKVFYVKPNFTSAKVKKIMDKTNDLKFRERLRLVNSLPRNLSEDDRKALYYYLKYEKNNTNTHCMKNDMLNILRNQTPPPPELTDVMLDLFYDKSEDIVIRSYALQHMRPWYMDERMQDPAIRQAFYDGLEEKENEIAGVALLALNYMAEQDTNFDKNVISQKAAEMAADENTYVLTRISAVSISGRMKNPEALETIRNLTNTPQPMALKLSAIASLGEIGEHKDIMTLQKISSTGKRPFSTAARAALKKLKKKLNI